MTAQGAYAQVLQKGEVVLEGSAHKPSTPLGGWSSSVTECAKLGLTA
jgi:hypothetical protein